MYKRVATFFLVTMVAIGIFLFAVQKWSGAQFTGWKFDDGGRKYLKTVRALMLEQNQPVEFYARVVDQNENPVSGARLELRLSRVDTEKVLEKFPHMKMGEEQMFVTNRIYSDGAGWMQLNGITGHLLDIMAFSKDGYVWTPPDNLGGLIFEPKGLRTASGKVVEIGDAFDPKKGYTFRLWKKGATEPLVPINFSVSTEPYGTNWYAVNLFSGKAADSKAGDFLFQFITQQDANGHPTRQFYYRAPFGGLAVDTGLYPYLAPAGGYQSTWEWLYEPYGKNDRDDASALMKRKFYLKLRNGKAYAALTWNFSATSVQLSGFINPNGSRNLEPDPEKLITDPAEIQRLDDQTRPR